MPSRHDSDAAETERRAMGIWRRQARPDALAGRLQEDQSRREGHLLGRGNRGFLQGVGHRRSERVLLPIWNTLSRRGVDATAA